MKITAKESTNGVSTWMDQFRNWLIDFVDSDPNKNMGENRGFVSDLFRLVGVDPDRVGLFAMDILVYLAELVR